MNINREKFLLPIAAVAILSLCSMLYAADLVVGTSVSLSGKSAFINQEQLNGFLIWLDEINERDGLLGRKVTLKYYDDESKPEISARIYEKLITVDKVDLLIGPYSSEMTMIASIVAEKYAMPMISAGSSASEIWNRGFKNIFGLYTVANTFMDQIIQFAKENQLERIALIYGNNESARDVAKGVRAKATKLNMHIVFENEYDNKSVDFSTMIIKMKGLKPDVVIGGSHLADSTRFMRQAKENKLNAKLFIFSAGPGLPNFGKNLGADAEGVMGNTQWEPTLILPGVEQFVTQYKNKYGTEPTYHSGGGYGNGQVLEAAVKSADSVEPEKLRTALHQLNIITTLGQFRVDETGKQIGKPSYMIQWIGGMRHLILPKKIATHEPLYPFPDWSKR